MSGLATIEAATRGTGNTTRATAIFGGQEPPKIRPLPSKISYFAVAKALFSVVPGRQKK
jgi:hypothetical protein